MDYEKKYREALERAKESMKDGGISQNTIDYLQNIFPELAESEDEKIIKALIKLVKQAGEGYENITEGVSIQKAVAWLEKQGEQKPVDNKLPEFKDKLCELFQRFRWYKDETPTNGDILEYVEAHIQELLGVVNEQKPADKVEPKFKVGDWVVYTGYLLKDSGKEIYVMQVASIEDDRYNFTDTSTLCFDSEKDMRLWTIADAKDGDVLACESGWTCIFKELNHNSFGEILFDSYCFIDRTRWFCDGAKGHTLDDRINGKIYPATKEQRNLLFQKMKEAGYEWDGEKKKLKKIEQKPVEWSEEDKEKIRSLLGILYECHSYGKCALKLNEYSKLCDWLKSLRPQKQ